MTWWLIATAFSILASVAGMAWRIYWLRSQRERELEKTIKTINETNKVLGEIDTRPRADNNSLADRFRLSKD